MRPVNKDLFTTNQITYNPYGEAKKELSNCFNGTRIEYLDF